MRGISYAALLVASLVAPAVSMAQGSLEARCDHPAVAAANARDACLAAAQAIVSSQPAVGLVIAGGSPTIGAAGATGFRLGFIPRVSAGLRLTIVPVRLPDLLAQQVGGTAGVLARRYGAPLPAFAGDMSVNLTPGFSLTPGIGGIGALDVLGSVSYLPIDQFADGFDSADIAHGIGARVRLLSESFTVPGVALSVMRFGLGEVGFGNICPSGVVPLATTGPDAVQVGVCPGGGSVGEFNFDLVTWSTRTVVNKHLLGIGAALGLGYDRFHSDLTYGFRGGQSTSPEGTFTFRAVDEELSSSSWTVFGNLSYTLVVATVAFDAGWQQGGAPIAGFRSLETRFDPGSGAWYGSFGVRISL